MRSITFRSIGHVENEFDEPVPPDDMRNVAGNRGERAARPWPGCHQSHAGAGHQAGLKLLST